MKRIEPKDLSTQSGRLIDVRGYDEFASVRLPWAECVPLDRLAGEAGKWDRSEPIILMCKSGMRSAHGAQQLESMGFTNVSNLAGGIEACRKQGMKTVSTPNRIPVFRQVMVMAGALLLAGLGLSYVYPAFIGLTWFVAAGLVFAGTTGYCPMAALLERMPWNRVNDAAGVTAPNAVSRA